MKKITAVVLTVIMLLSVASLAACGKETTKSIYEKSAEKMLSVDAYEAKMAMAMEMTVSGQSITTEMDYVIKADDLKSASPIGYVEINMDMLGQSVEAISYTEGDYVYVYSMGEGMKMPKDSELAGDYSAEGTLDSYEIDVPAEILEATEFATDDDGNYVLSFDFNGEEHADILKDFTANVMSGLDASLSGYEVSIGDVKYVLTINKDDYTLENMKIEMTMDMTVEGMEMAIDVVAECEYVAFGDDVTITPPEGYQDYEELTA